MYDMEFLRSDDLERVPVSIKKTKPFKFSDQSPVATQSIYKEETSAEFSTKYPESIDEIILDEKSTAIFKIPSITIHNDIGCTESPVLPRRSSHADIRKSK